MCCLLHDVIVLSEGQYYRSAYIGRELVVVCMRVLLGEFLWHDFLSESSFITFVLELSLSEDILHEFSHNWITLSHGVIS